jgi:hypothetical protein
LDIIIQTPDTTQLISQLNTVLSPIDLETAMQRIAYAALDSIRAGMAAHSRSGLTRDSLNTWIVSTSPDSVSVATGTQSRGQILKWLDRGRGPVRPTTRKVLRWFTFPEHIAVFARYARATQGTALMTKAGVDAINQAPNIIARTLTATATYQK